MALPWPAPDATLLLSGQEVSALLDMDLLSLSTMGWLGIPEDKLALKGATRFSLHARGALLQVLTDSWALLSPSRLTL